MKRDLRIVNLRALAIVLVVLGHSIIIYNTSWSVYKTDISAPVFDCLKKWINLIQMPVFLGISGFLFQLTYRKYNFKTFFIKKCYRLLVPFVIFSLFWMIPIRKAVHFHDYYERNIFEIFFRTVVIENDDGHLWYLTCLFACLMVSFAIMKFIDRTKYLSELYKTMILFVISVIVKTLRVIVPANAAFTRQFCNRWIWFCLGAVMFGIKDELLTISKIKVYIAAIAILILSIAYACSIIPEIFKVVSFIMVPLAYLIVPNKKIGILDFLSDNSFGVYLIHSPLVYISYSQFPNINPIIMLVINFVGFGGIAILLTLLIKKTPFSFIVSG